MWRWITRLAVIHLFILVHQNGFSWTGSFEEIKAATDNVNAISSEFIQEKHLAILKKPLISKGILYYQRPDSLRWEYRTPIPSLLISHKGEIKRFFKQGDRFQEDAGAHLQAMQIVIQEITNWIGGEFYKNPDFMPELAGDSLVVLSPKKDEIKHIISHIELVLSKQPGVIKSATIYENERSFTRLIFTSPLVNHAISTSIFQNP